MNAQMSEPEKQRLANHTIMNTDIFQLEAQLKEILNKLKN
jgi:hypothetical protein